MKVNLTVVLTNTVTNPLTVVVHHENTFATTTAMIVSRWFSSMTNQAFSQINILLLFLLETCADIVILGLTVTPQQQHQSTDIDAVPRQQRISIS
jgi:hypothetical protein